MATTKSKLPSSFPVFMPVAVMPGTDIKNCVVVKVRRKNQETFAAFAGSAKWSYVKLYEAASNALGRGIVKLGGFHFRVEVKGGERRLVVWGGDPKTGTDYSGTGQLLLSRHFGLVKESRQ